jgi:hypothetical protein
VPLTLRPATPADVQPLLDLVDGVVAWLVARGRSGQWGMRPLEQRGEPWTGTVRVRPA